MKATKDITKMTDEEILKYLRTSSKQPNSTLINKTSTILLNKKFEEKGIKLICPKCGSVNLKKNGTNKNGVVIYKCKDCGKSFNLTANTLFAGNEFQWNDMVLLLLKVIHNSTVEDITNEFTDPAKHPMPFKITNDEIWLMKMKMIYLMAQQPKPVLSGVVQVDETFFRESQKGKYKNGGPKDFLDKTGNSLRKSRKTKTPSINNTMGPEFVNVLAAIDNSKHCIIKCIALGKTSKSLLEEHLTPYLKDIDYFCSDKEDAFTSYCKAHHFEHFISPSDYRKIRIKRGYVNTDNRGESLPKEILDANHAINEQMYKEGIHQHIEGRINEIEYDAFSSLKYKFGLSTNAVNNLHSRMKREFEHDSRTVNSKYLDLYVQAFAFLENWKADHNIKKFNSIEAEKLLVYLTNYSITHQVSITRDELRNMTAINLPRTATWKNMLDSKKAMERAHKFIKTYYNHFDGTKTTHYEADFVGEKLNLNLKDYFHSLGETKIIELAKANLIYDSRKSITYHIDKLSRLDNALEIQINQLVIDELGLKDIYTPLWQDYLENAKGNWAYGRPTKKMLIRLYRKENPDATIKQCVEETGISQPTVNRWWNSV